MKYLIVNADDLGICESTNRAIHQAHREGILTSASLMANGPAFDHAVKHVVGPNQQLGIGLHLCLTSGRSTLPSIRVPSLVDSFGRFRHGFVSLWRAIRQQPQYVLPQIEAEFEAQYQRLRNAGTTIDHVDSHRHIHMIPPVCAIVCRQVRQWGTPAVRLPIEQVPRLGALLTSGHSMTVWRNMAKQILLSALGGTNRRLFSGLQTANHTFGVLGSGHMDQKAIELALTTARDGLSEILTHPGETDAQVDSATNAADGRFLRCSHRSTELDTLLDPRIRSLIEQLGFSLVSFSRVRDTDTGMPEFGVSSRPTIRKPLKPVESGWSSRSRIAAIFAETGDRGNT